jgi:hypothetical protein
MRKVEIPKCPKCKVNTKVIPILYGMPPTDLFEEEREGKVRLGGCVAGKNFPNWFCNYVIMTG